MLDLKGKIRGYDIIISIFSLMLITSSIGIMTIHFAYGQSDQMRSSNDINLLDVQNIQAKKVHVGDIDIAYKVFGKGEPFLLISGSGLVMDAWDPLVLRDLSTNHTVVIFDNRGV